MGERIPIPEEKRCTANKAGSGGQRCQNAAIKGGKVCPAHGGSAIQVRQKAQERLLAMADPALNALVEIVTNGDEKLTGTRLAAARDILDRIGLSATQKVETEVTVVTKDDLEQMIQAYAEGYEAGQGEKVEK